MKRILYILFALLLLMASKCNDEEPEEEIINYTIYIQDTIRESVYVGEYFYIRYQEKVKVIDSVSGNVLYLKLEGISDMRCSGFDCNMSEDYTFVGCFEVRVGNAKEQVYHICAGDAKLSTCLQDSCVNPSYSVRVNNVNYCISICGAEPFPSANGMPYSKYDYILYVRVKKY